MTGFEEEKGKTFGFKSFVYVARDSDIQEALLRGVWVREACLGL